MTINYYRKVTFYKNELKKYINSTKFRLQKLLQIL